jgi:hypothetical protein
MVCVGSRNVKGIMTIMRDAERSEEVLCSQIDDGVRMHLYLSTTVVVRFDAIREGATATAESLVIWYMEKRGMWITCWSRAVFGYRTHLYKQRKKSARSDPIYIAFLF